MTRACFVALLAAFATLACSNSSGGNQTVNVNGLDCGLIRADMVGTWTVSFTPGVATLQNCGPTGAKNGTAFDVPAGTANYTVADAAVSQQSVGFSATGVGPNNIANELIATIEADSCLAVIQTWENDDKGWAVCLGTADRTNRIINTVCDSVALDTDADGKPDTNCDLSASFTAAVGIP